MVSSSDDDENNSNANEKSYSVDYEVSPEVEATRKPTPPTNPNLPKVLVAGGGIAGLITAAACKRKGMEVVVFETIWRRLPTVSGPQIQYLAIAAWDRNDEVLLGLGDARAIRVPADLVVQRPRTQRLGRGEEGHPGSRSAEAAV